MSDLRYLTDFIYLCHDDLLAANAAAGAASASSAIAHASSSMSKRDTKLFKVLIGQIAEDGGVDVILAKRARTRTCRAFEPVGNLLHYSRPVSPGRDLRFNATGDLKHQPAGWCVRWPLLE